MIRFFELVYVALEHYSSITLTLTGDALNRVRVDNSRRTSMVQEWNLIRVPFSHRMKFEASLRCRSNLYIDKEKIKLFQHHQTNEICRTKIHSQNFIPMASPVY